MKFSIRMLFLGLACASVFTGHTAYAVDQSMCHAGATVSLYDSGALKACQLEKEYDANGIQCKSNNSVSFYNNGNLESCVLSRPATLDVNKCREDGPISFYVDGKLKSCMKPDN